MKNKNKRKKKSFVTKYLEQHFERVENPTPKMIRRRTGACLMIMNMLIWFVVGDQIGLLSVPERLVFVNNKVIAATQESQEAQEANLPGSTDTDGSWGTGGSDGGMESETPSSHADSSLHKLISQTFPEDPHVAVAIATSESGLNPTQESTTDKMSDGRPFSVGLMQINLTVSEVAGVNCTKAFHGRNYHATVVDEDLYKKCVKLAKDPKNSLEAARHKYDGRNQTWLAWGAFTNGAYKRFLTIQ